jgi:hypothetical protein
MCASGSLSVAHEGVVEAVGAVLDEVLAGLVSRAIALGGSGPRRVAFDAALATNRDAT